MGRISVRPETGRLYFDFKFQGHRCREQTTLLDNKGNRKLLEKQLLQIQAEIHTNTFNYAKHFPESPFLKRLNELDQELLLSQAQVQISNTIV